MNDSNSERLEEHPSRSGDTSQEDRPRKGVSRRGFIQKLSALGLAGFGASAVLAGCGSDEGSGNGSSTGSGESASSTTTAANDLVCDDVSALSASEKERREAQIQALQYVEQTEKPDQNCENCLFWQAPTGGSECGGCQLFPGPVNPNGWCSTWQAKVG